MSRCDVSERERQKGLVHCTSNLGLSKGLFIKLSDLAATLVEACINPPQKRILENEDIKQAVIDRKLGGWIWSA